VKQTWSDMAQLSAQRDRLDPAGEVPESAHHFKRTPPGKMKGRGANIATPQGGGLHHRYQRLAA
jgi:hypothetical protein